MKYLKYFILLLAFMCAFACKKNWLDGKPSKSLVVPSTVADYQALLDNTSAMNTQLPTLSMVGDGDYYISDTKYNSLSVPQEKGAYIWANTVDFYGGQPGVDWITAYGRILQTNVVLDGLKSLSVVNSDLTAFNNVKGSALFYRSLDLFYLSQQYCKTFDAKSAGTDLGLPLRISSNVNLKVNRSTLQATYDLFIGDLLTAIPLLPVTPTYPTRPCKPAAYGLLARIYLSQENYEKALLYSDSCLQLKHDLMNYNAVTPKKLAPFTRFNTEVIYHTALGNYASAFPVNAQIVSPDLYQLYSSNDLRQTYYFINNGDGQNHVAYQGSYTGAAIPPFGGIATDEMFLTRSECYARAGNLTAALNDLNTLLQNRYKTGTFSALTASNTDAALSLILTERRKELCFRNLRWTDLRRLNKDSRFQITLTRTINGVTYTLPPNSPKYVLPLDPIETTSGGLQQNTR
jgi:tetratricopeptide (TPR) repeat protein